MIFFIHIPKVGGLSFRENLIDEYGYVKEFWDLVPGGSEMVHEFDSEFYRNHPQKRRQIVEAAAGARYPAIFGHVPLWLVYKANARFVTWMRDPVKQVMSRIFYWRQEGILDADKTDPWELITWPVFQNNQFLYTGGDLDRFAFIGITEHWNEDLRRAVRILGWERTPTPVHIHQTGHEESERKRLEADESFVAEIRRLNFVDCALYDYALELRCK